MLKLLFPSSSTEPTKPNVGITSPDSDAFYEAELDLKPAPTPTPKGE